MIPTALFVHTDTAGAVAELLQGPVENQPGFLSTCVNTALSLISQEPHFQISPNFSCSRWVPYPCQDGLVIITYRALASHDTCQSHLESWIRTSNGLFDAGTTGAQEALAPNTVLQILLLFSRRWDDVSAGEVWLAPNWLYLIE